MASRFFSFFTQQKSRTSSYNSPKNRCLVTLDVRQFGDTKLILRTRGSVQKLSTIQFSFLNYLAVANLYSTTFFLNERSILITLLQLGHFISIIPVVGVILSITRQLHMGHLLITLIFILSAIIITSSQLNIKYRKRIIKIFFI